MATKELENLASASDFTAISPEPAARHAVSKLAELTHVLVSM
jgi:hypothetical protein